MARLKKIGKSFTELIKRITSSLRKKKLSDFAGILDDEQFEKATIESRRSGTDFSRLEKVKL